MPVDLFGQPADHAAIGAVAADEALFVLDDAAQAFGYAVYLLLALPFVLATSYGWMFLRYFSQAEESTLVSSGVAAESPR